MAETAAQCFIINPPHLMVPEEDKKVQKDPFMVNHIAQRFKGLPFFQYRMMFLGALLAVTFVLPGFFTGLIWGLYLSFIGFLYFFVSEPRPTIDRHPSLATGEEPVPVEFTLEQGTEASSAEGNALGLGEGIIYRV
ncbi:unnamed protein product, partial [Cylicostephanus goldi]